MDTDEGNQSMDTDEGNQSMDTDEGNPNFSLAMGQGIGQTWSHRNGGNAPNLKGN